jgi:vancomycin resistance protein YoaR
MNDLKSAVEMHVRPMKRGGKNKLFLMISGGVLLAALIVCAVLLLQTPPVEDNADRVIEFGTVMKGVSVGGIDISGLTKEEALAATAELPTQLLAQVNFTIDVAGEQMTFTAQDFALHTDYDAVIEQAVAYGRTGSFDDRLAAAKIAVDQGVDFAVSLTIDETALKATLAQIKTEMDKEPLTSMAVFTPWGHYADGTKYEPDKQALIEASLGTTELTYPEGLVRLTEEEMPLRLRYQYWENSKYKDYIPAAATIARFYYTPEQTGIIADTEAIAADIMAQVESGTFSTIIVPVQVTEPTTTLEQVKAQTQLITSWTSSYSDHFSKNRNWNVAKLSGIICGVQIDPGVEWSINDTAGARTVAKGWKEASGIVDGGYVDQAGGGVCQISSTLFNVAIRARLGTQSKHHSIVSGYIPKGLDATISTGGPDLKLTNTHDAPVYIVSYMNPETKSVTVEIYGPAIIDVATGEEVIYDFVPGSVSYYGEPKMQDIWDARKLPDGTELQPGQSKVYAEARKGMRVTTHRHYYKLDGTKYNEEVFEKVDIGPNNGKTYHYDPDPATVTPTPVITESAPATSSEDGT